SPPTAPLLVAPRTAASRSKSSVPAKSNSLLAVQKKPPSGGFFFWSSFFYKSSRILQNLIQSASSHCTRRPALSPTQRLKPCDRTDLVHRLSSSGTMSPY